MRTFVVDRAIRNDDGPLHWYCFGPCAPHNFYWYEEPTEETVTLIPWDLDNAFDNMSGGGVAGTVTFIADPFGQITNDCQPFPFGALGLLQLSAACDPLIGAVSTLTAEFDQIRAELHRRADVGGVGQRAARHVDRADRRLRRRGGRQPTPTPRRSTRGTPRSKRCAPT